MKIIKKNIIQHFIILFFIGILFSCQKELILDIPQTEEQIVVDGYIESNSYPFVILTRTVPFFSEIDSAELYKLLVNTAKVSVSNGTETEILTLQKNDAFFPPYVYRGTSIKGEIGKTYSLKVEVNNKIISSETTITQSAKIDSVWFELNENSDSLGVLWMQIQDDPSEKNYYRIVTKRKGKDDKYIPSMIFSTFDDANFDGKLFKTVIYKGITELSHPLNDLYFNINDTVYIKVNTMDKDSYDCWFSLQNEMISFGNPLSNANNPIETNIKNGIGVWSGFGTTNYIFTPKILKSN